MAGNELQVVKFLFDNIGKIKLNHLGIVKQIGAPSADGFQPVDSVGALTRISTEDARKKADVYINGKGVSIKQIGGSFSFNRLQRANLYDVYKLLGFKNIDRMLNQIDNEVIKFHKGLLDKRNRPWEDFFSREDFKSLLKFLMMDGSPNYGFSSHKAELILEAPALCYNSNDISVYTFDEYFSKYENKFKIAIRRQWVGQSSDSEHNRAVSLKNKEGNAPWVFNDVVGTPRSGWRTEVPVSERRTVYFLMIEKVR
jgi:hypothetical protein